MERMLFGQVDGKDVHRVSITVGDYRMDVLTYGANLCWFGTKEQNFVLSHDAFEDYIDDPSYQGSVVGPVANRIKGGSFEVDGKEFQLDLNDGPNTLHSASACYGRRVWSIAGLGANSISLILSTEKGLGGFPGSHEIMVTYSLYEDGCLNILYRTSSSEKCPVAITNHAYFNLNRASKDIRNTVLTIPADRYVEVDDALIPIAVEDVDGTDFDFRIPRAIGDRRNGSYDNTFILNQGAIIRAEGDAATLECRTTEPSFQLYTAEYLSDEHGQYSGFCIETGRYPDTPNHDDYPQAFTAPGEFYISNTTYRLRVR